MQGLTWASVVIGVWAAGVGAFMSLHNLIMVEYVGLDKLVPTLGICGVFSGLSSVVIGPVIGRPMRRCLLFEWLLSEVSL